MRFPIVVGRSWDVGPVRGWAWHASRQRLLGLRWHTMCWSVVAMGLAIKDAVSRCQEAGLLYSLQWVAGVAAELAHAAERPQCSSRASVSAVAGAR